PRKVRLVTAPARVDADILAVGPPQFLQCVNECRQIRSVVCIGRFSIHENAHSPHLTRLLCPRRQGPGSRRAGEKRDEPASLDAAAHSITSSARARNDSGIARPIAFAVLRLMTSSNLVGCTTGRSAGFSPLRMRPV